MQVKDYVDGQYHVTAGQIHITIWTYSFYAYGWSNVMRNAVLFGSHGSRQSKPAF